MGELRGLEALDQHPQVCVGERAEQECEQVCCVRTRGGG